MAKLIKYLFSTRSLPIIICTSLMLFFLGIYFLIAFKSKSFVESLKNESNVLVEIKSNTSDEGKSLLLEELKSLEGVLDQSIQYISKEEAFLIMRDDLGGSFLANSEDNPFLDVFQFNLTKNIHIDSVFLSGIRSYKMVHNAYIQNSYVEEISKNVRRFSGIALIIGLFFTGLALIMIFNAIKLSLVESKSSFYTLKLLGSDWDFIKKPFLQRAFYVGLLSGIMAIILLISSLTYLSLNNQMLHQLINVGSIIIVSTIMLMAGFAVNLISTNIILNNFLKMREEDLYKF